MSIHVRCGKCGTEFAVSSQRAGARVKCKHCGRAVSVRGSAIVDAPSAPRPRTRKSTSKSRQTQDKSETSFAEWIATPAGIMGLVVVSCGVLTLLWFTVGAPIVSGIQDQMAQAEMKRHVEWLGNSSDETARKSEAALRKYGADAAIALAHGLQSSNRPVRERSLELLERLGPDAAHATDELAAGLNSKGSGIKAIVLKALAAIGPKASSAADQVRPLLHDPNAKLRSASLATFVAVAAPADAVSAALELLEDEDLAVLTEACRALGQLKTDCATSMEELLKVRNKLEPTEKSDDVRIAIHEAIVACGVPAPNVIAAVAADAKLPDASPRLRASAFLTLGQCGPDALQYFGPALEQKQFVSFAVDGLVHQGKAVKPLVPNLIAAIQLMRRFESQARAKEAMDVGKNTGTVTTVRNVNSFGEVSNERSYGYQSIYNTRTSSLTDESDMASNIRQWHRGVRVGREILSSLGINSEAGQENSGPGEGDNPPEKQPASE